MVVVRDGDDRGSAADREDVAGVIRDRGGEQRADRRRRRRRLGLRARLRERIRCLPEPGAKPGDPNRSRMLADADECRGLLEIELPGEKLRARSLRLPAPLLLGQRPLNA